MDVQRERINGDAAPPMLDRISPIVNGNVEREPAIPEPEAEPADMDVDPDPPAAPYVDCLASIRVLTQSFAINNFSVVDCRFDVYTELTVVPLVPNLQYLNLHLARSALLPNECEFGGRVTVNDVDASYARVEHSLNGTRPTQTPSLKVLLNHMQTSMVDENDCTLRIAIPKEFLESARDMNCMRVGVNVFIRKPKIGVKFVKYVARDGTIEKGTHAFTYRSSPMSGTRCWLPCLDAPDQLSLWRFSITCDASHVAVASAELMDVELSDDLKLKTYHYQQSVPTSPCSMGWAVGNFFTYGHPETTEFTSFALPGLLSLVRHTVQHVDKILEYFEELLSCRYPFPSYKLVFVDQIPDEVTSYSSLTIFSVNVLYHKKIIDVVQESRRMIAYGAAQQFFGNFIVPYHWVDWWLTKSLASLTTYLYIEKVFGNSEYMFHIRKISTSVIDYETQWGKIILRPVIEGPARTNIHCDPRYEETCSPLYAEASAHKGLLVMRMLQKRIGREPFLQVLHKVLTVGQQMSERRDRPASWTHMVLSTESFFRTVSSVTGHEIPTFLEQWIFQGGHADFQIQYTFNRKRNMIELEVKQDVNDGNGRLRYVGPLVVVVQELDGCFSHTVQIDGDISRSELQCHSKGRRQKKKKVPLYTGEEVEIDLSNMDPDSPVLWIRADPELLLLRHMVIRQPNYQWEYMLKYERDVIAQLQALARLQQFPSAQTRTVLLEIISNEQLFYRIRCRAAFALSMVLNRMSESWSGQPDLIEIFRKEFGSRSCPNIPRPNNFVATSQYLQQYFLMQALPQAVARLRTQHNQPIADVQIFISDLIRFNDNSMNRYSDDHYRSALIYALYGCAAQNGLASNSSVDELAREVVPILRELTMALNMDTMKSSFGKVVAIAALSGIYKLQTLGHLPHDSTIFWNFASANLPIQLRKASIAILVDRIAVVRDSTCLSDLCRLLSMAEHDSDPTIRITIPTLLSLTPPFTTNNNGDFSSSNPCNTPLVADEIWRLINAGIDMRAKMLFYDLYFSLFGLGVPPSKGGPLNAPGHHRLYIGTQSRLQASTFDEDRPESPQRHLLNANNNDMEEDMLH